MRLTTVRKRALLALSPVLSFFFAACGGTPATTTIVEPPSGPMVTVSVASVALAGDCGDGSMLGVSGGACALDANGMCRSTCQQSSLVLKVSASDGTGTVSLQVVAVRIRNEGGGGVDLDRLTARAPEKWSGTSYVALDQTIAPLDNFTISYKTSAPDWTALGGKQSYRVEVDLIVGGEMRTVGIEGVTHVPPVAT